MILLGSTGSIGKTTLEVAKEYDIDVDVLTCNTNIKLLNKQIEEFKPSYVVVSDKSLVKDINHPNILTGDNALTEVINLSKSDLVINALVGFTGLKPTLETLKSGKHLALANKESLVVAGKFIDTSNIFPIDSEHFSLKYMLKGRDFKKLIITASGGALRDAKDLSKVTIKDVLSHPNWSMGNKITVDSANMTNKLFELLEARWLFNTNRADAVIERNSLVHALVEFDDGISLLNMSNPSMKIPIIYALTNKVRENSFSNISLIDMPNIKFQEITAKQYPIWEIKDEILNRPDLGVIVNSANDFLVEKFLNKKISFIEITKGIIKAIDKFNNTNISSLDDIFTIHREVKEFLIKC